MSAYEYDVNLPFYVRGPGVPKGIKLPHLVGASCLNCIAGVHLRETGRIVTPAL